MPHSRSAFADNTQVSLHYRVCGRGPRSLVLIHELAGTLESFDRVVPPLAADFRILRADQRGAGLSEKVRAPFGLDDLVTDALALLRVAGLEPPYYVAGIASGAAIAAEGCEIAALTPDELAAFAAAVKPIYAEARALYPEQILKLLPRGM